MCCVALITSFIQLFGTDSEESQDICSQDFSSVLKERAPPVASMTVKRLQTGSVSAQVADSLAH